MRPLRQGIPTIANEIDRDRDAAGSKFDAVVTSFAMQYGQRENAEEREKIFAEAFRNKEHPKAKEPKGRKKNGGNIVGGRRQRRPERLRLGAKAASRRPGRAQNWLP